MMRWLHRRLGRQAGTVADESPAADDMRLLFRVVAEKRHRRETEGRHLFQELERRRAEACPPASDDLEEKRATLIQAKASVPASREARSRFPALRRPSLRVPFAFQPRVRFAFVPSFHAPRVRLTKGRVSVVGVVALALTVGTGVFAYWTSSGTGSASAAVSGFDAPENVQASNAPGSGTVHVTWDSVVAPDGGAVDGYYVQRFVGSTPSAACMTSPASLTTNTNCNDLGVADGSYTYKVTAVFRSWTAESDASNSVTVVNDNDPPDVTSITRDDTSPTNAASVSWTVTFDEDVNGVGASDFTLVGAGATGASITSVSPSSGPENEYVVEVSTGNDGNLGLNLVDDDSITDPSGNKLGGTGVGNGSLTGEVYVIDKTAPTVTSINRAGATLTNATSVSWTVVISEAVSGVDAADFALAQAGGVTGATITGVTGSGPYTITANTGSNGGTLGLNLVDDDSISDGVGNQLGGTGAGNGSFTGQIYTIDKTPPTVSNVSSTQANGAYKAGVTIPITVTFSELVNVTGTPQLLLETGAVDRNANYVSGSGTTTLTFNYTVQAGDTTSDLDYVATNSLALNGGTVRDPATNDATLTLPAPGAAGSLAANKALVIDTTPPTVSNVSSTQANGAYKAGVTIPITVTFSELVNVTGTPQLLLETGAVDRNANYVSGSGTTTLTFNYTVQAGDTTSDLDYVATNSLALNGGTVRDPATNDATLTLPAPGAAGSLAANKALVIDTTPPTVSNVSSTQANGAYKAGVTIPITVTFSELVNVTGTPQLLLETGAVDRNANYVSGSGTTTLTFNYTVQAGDTTSDLDYVATNSLALNGGTVRDPATNDATLTLPAPGAAGSLAANKALVIDTTPPTVSNVSSTQANGAYTVGAVIPVTVTFSEPVNVTGTPQLLLETGTTDRNANYSSGTGSNSLTFNYTVQAGDTSADLNYVATNSLTLNGGAIQDAATNNAALTLPGLAAAGSLATNKNIVIDTTGPTVISINRVAASPTSSTSVQWTVTFSETVTGVNAADFTLVQTGALSGASITSVTGTGPYTVTASTGSNSGTLGLNLVDDDSISDSVGNKLGGTGAGNGNFIGQIYAIDKTAPVVTITGVTDGGGNSKVTISGTGTAGDGSVTVVVCPTNVFPCASPIDTVTASVSGGGTWSGTTGNIGTNPTLYARATQTDAAGNTGVSAVFGPFHSPLP